MGAVAAQNHKAVQLKLMVILLHSFHLIQAVCIGILYRLKGSAGGSENGSALGQDSGKILAGKHHKLSVDQALIAVQKSVDLYFFTTGKQCLYHTSHRGIQCLAISAAGQHSDSLHGFALRQFIRVSVPYVFCIHLKYYLFFTDFATYSQGFLSKYIVP